VRRIGGANRAKARGTDGKVPRAIAIRCLPQLGPPSALLCLVVAAAAVTVLPRPAAASLGLERTVLDGRPAAGRVETRLEIAEAAVSVDEPAAAPDPGSDSSGHDPSGHDPLFDDFDAELEAQQTGYPDPMQPLNRKMLDFNQFLDRFAFKPATQAYRFLVPDRGRVALRNFFLNIGSTPILVNDILQGEPVDASTTLARLVLNSVFGIAGFVDAAATMGYQRHSADFGQTLALYGVGSGPYLVMPLFGPSTFRDAIGGMVDSVLHPTTYVLGPIQRLFYGGSSGLTTLDAHYDALEALQESSVDYYAALRNAYYQSRRSTIWSRRNGPPPPWKPYWGTPAGRCCRWASCRRWQTNLQSCVRSIR